MSIREDLERVLIKTHQLTQTRRHKWLFAIAVLLSLVGAFRVFEPEYWQMRRVQRHIENISPQWDAFKRAHPGFESVELFPRHDLAYGVRFAAKGRVPWNVDLNQLAEFMRSHQPPFPVDISNVEKSYGRTEKRTFVMPDGSEKELEVLLEPGRAANKSQPIQPGN